MVAIGKQPSSFLIPVIFNIYNNPQPICYTLPRAKKKYGGPHVILHDTFWWTFDLSASTNGEGKPLWHSDTVGYFYPLFVSLIYFCQGALVLCSQRRRRITAAVIYSKKLGRILPRETLNLVWWSGGGGCVKNRSLTEKKTLIRCFFDKTRQQTSL